VLMTTFLHAEGIDVAPLHVAVWGIPTAICAFIIHSIRLARLDRRLDRELGYPGKGGDVPGGLDGKGATATTASTTELGKVRK
jgi:hypothetical protein